jgi:hypothetical protein
MSEQPKEWTPELVHDLLHCSGRDNPYAYVADAHNAALAAEHNHCRATQVELDGADKVIANLKQQLAAERERMSELQSCIEVMTTGYEAAYEAAYERGCIDGGLPDFEALSRQSYADYCKDEPSP